MKMKIMALVVVLLVVTGCASRTPLPQCKGEFYPINGEIK